MAIGTAANFKVPAQVREGGKMSVVKPREAATGGGGGGGDSPDWLPSGARSFLDFVNGHYYANGAEAAVTDLLVSDEDYGTVFNAADIEQGTGWVVHGDNSEGDNWTIGPNFAGGLLTDMYGSSRDGSTMVFDMVMQNRTAEETDFEFALTWASDPAFAVAWNLQIEEALAYCNVGGQGVQSFTSAQFLEPLGARNRIAFTMTPTGFAVSVNGAITERKSDFTGFDSLVDCFWYVLDNIAVVTSITVYPPQDDADLPALSFRT